MSEEQRLIVVAGATGRQGGAVARRLLSQGTWRVRGLTRDPTKVPARALADMGADMVRADFNDRASLDRAFEGAYGVFSMQNFWGTGYEMEVRQGRNVADAAAAAGVQHLVYDSVGGADRNTGIPHFESKWEIEQHLRTLGLPYTVFRPVFFMENFNTQSYRDAILDGRLPFGLKPETKLQMIAVEDIGAFVAMAFANRDRFLSQGIEIGGDALTMPEVASHFGDVLGRPVEFLQLPLDEMREASPEWAVMLEWFETRGYRANIEELRRMHPGLLTFPQWLERSEWSSFAVSEAA
jgi:uncharacterized protein YbjT (DUF2867 family)